MNKISLAITGLLLLCCNCLYAVKLPVNNGACKYSVALPDGWDTIPQTFITEKLQQQLKVDAAIYPVEQSDYTEGNYALIGFMLMLKSLNAFTFKQIVAEIDKSNRLGEIHSDTINIAYAGIDTLSQNGIYRIFSRFSIEKDTVTVKSCQMLFLTKFGYVSVVAYRKGNQGKPLNEISALLTNIISVEPDYQYKEFEKKGIGLKHILISLLIGVIVFLIISVTSKKKQQ